MRDSAPSLAASDHLETDGLVACHGHTREVLAGVFDPTGTIVARTVGAETYVGQKGTPEYIARILDQPASATVVVSDSMGDMFGRDVGSFRELRGAPMARRCGCDSKASQAHVQQLEEALHRAKSEGRNRVVCD